MSREIISAGPIPFLLNLGQPEEVIGWSKLERSEDGKVTMTVDFGPDGSRLMDQFMEIAELKAIGFAGVVREGMHERSREVYARSLGGAGRQEDPGDSGARRPGHR